MKRILSTLLLASSSTFAGTCGIVIPLPPGGALDIYARTMQRINKEVVVDYKPGAYMAQAINYIENNKSYAILSVPSMYSTQNPLVKDHVNNIELIKIISSSDQVVLTNKGLNFQQLLTGKINIGIPLVGGPQHIIAMQIKEKNPDVEIIPLGGDVKALPAIKLNDVDIYITAAANADKWVEEFKFKQVVRVPAARTITEQGVQLTNMVYNSIFVHRGATQEQRENIVNCVNDVTRTDEWNKTLKSIGVTSLDVQGKEKDKVISDYIKMLQKYGF